MPVYTYVFPLGVRPEDGPEKYPAGLFSQVVEDAWQKRKFANPLCLHRGVLLGEGGGGGGDITPPFLSLLTVPVEEEFLSNCFSIYFRHCRLHPASIKGDFDLDRRCWNCHQCPF